MPLDHTTSRESRRARRRERRRRETRRIATLLRTETVGGALLVAAAALALIVANTPLVHAYLWLKDLRIGPASLHLDLTVAQWTADGLLAIFFFLAGLELKREFTVGELRDPRRAVVPVLAAVGGMLVPAGIYLLVNAGNTGAEVGWAIPTATDIAFALAVLAVVGRHLPAVLRTFLLTLAVVDDLLAIIVIALFYTRELHPAFLLAALVPVALFGWAVQRGITAWWVLLPPALAAWGLMHASGVHATVAGVLMGFTVPVLARRRGRPEGHDPATGETGVAAKGGTGDGTKPRAGDAAKRRRRAAVPDLAGRLDRRVRPISAGLAVPLFAFFAAGVPVGGLSGLASALEDRVTIGIIAGLIAGKTVGILLTTLLANRLTGSDLLAALRLPDLAGLAVLGGVGFTVSLLIGELAFLPESAHGEHVPIAVLIGSVIAAAAAAAILGARSRRYRRTGVPTPS